MYIMLFKGKFKTVNQYLFHKYSVHGDDLGDSLKTTVPLREQFCIHFAELLDEVVITGCKVVHVAGKDDLLSYLFKQSSFLP